MSENIYTAISEIQANPPALLKDGRGQYGAYLTLGNLVDAVVPLLHEQGVTVVQIPRLADGQPALYTQLMHAASDSCIEGTMPLMSAQANPQQQGSAITYARRYALASMLGLVADEDDDGQTATNATRTTTRRAVDSQPVDVSDSSSYVRPPADAIRPF